MTKSQGSISEGIQQLSHKEIINESITTDSLFYLTTKHNEENHYHRWHYQMDMEPSFCIFEVQFFFSKEANALCEGDMHGTIIHNVVLIPSTIKHLPLAIRT